jgi:hypothetical protein
MLLECKNDVCPAVNGEVVVVTSILAMVDVAAT